MNKPLERPLLFGDQEQIAAVRELERETLWKTLENCETCKGDGECTRCGHDCDQCAMTGKISSDYGKWIKAFPGWLNPWSMK